MVIVNIPKIVIQWINLNKFDRIAIFSSGYYDIFNISISPLCGGHIISHDIKVMTYEPNLENKKKSYIYYDFKIISFL